MLEYNKLFAEENDQIRNQYATIVKYVEECKEVIKEERDKCLVLEAKNKELEDKIKKYEVPDRGMCSKKSTKYSLCTVKRLFFLLLKKSRQFCGLPSKVLTVAFGSL